jgi:hypothetical protein
MNTNPRLRNVGAIDPELNSSPVAEETDEEAYILNLEAPETDVCYFNSEMFRNGELVRSGTAVLECRRGIWVEIGPSDPQNP